MKNEDYFEYIKGKSFREKLLAFGDSIENAIRQSIKASERNSVSDAKWYREESKAQMERADFLFRLIIDEYESKTERKMLNDYYEWEFSEEESYIEVKGKGKSQYEMTLSPEYRDDECMRVVIDGEYYYFG